MNQRMSAKRSCERSLLEDFRGSVNEPCGKTNPMANNWFFARDWRNSVARFRRALFEHAAGQNRMFGIDDQPVAMRVDQHIHVLHRNGTQQRLGISRQDDGVEI